MIIYEASATALEAYSTWKILPSGEKIVASISYYIINKKWKRKYSRSTHDYSLFTSDKRMLCEKLTKPDRFGSFVIEYSSITQQGWGCGIFYSL